jgi:hypothetical protein
VTLHCFSIDRRRYLVRAITIAEKETAISGLRDARGRTRGEARLYVRLCHVSRFIESRLRELQTLAHRESATIELTARAESYPLRTWRGHQLLKEVHYEFSVRRLDGSTNLIGMVDISVPPPGSSSQITFGVKGGAAGPWSLQ